MAAAAPAAAMQVSVPNEYMGRVIGKAGRTATALRTVVNALSDKGNVRIDILDVDGR
jgi:predicted RNA-binding protein YlqC (UPF0109 family)